MSASMVQIMYPQNAPVSPLRSTSFNTNSHNHHRSSSGQLAAASPSASSSELQNSSSNNNRAAPSSSTGSPSSRVPRGQISIGSFAGLSTATSDDLETVEAVLRRFDRDHLMAYIGLESESDDDDDINDITAAPRERIVPGHENNYLSGYAALTLADGTVIPADPEVLHRDASSISGPSEPMGFHNNNNNNNNAGSRSNDNHGSPVQDDDSDQDDEETKMLSLTVQKLAEHSIEVPPHFICPITREVMLYPVVASDGQSYEKFAIVAWLKEHNTSPMTNKIMKSNKIIQNFTLRSMIREFIDRNQLKLIQMEKDGRKDA